MIIIGIIRVISVRKISAKSKYIINAGSTEIVYNFVKLFFGRRSTRKVSKCRNREVILYMSGYFRSINRCTPACPVCNADEVGMINGKLINGVLYRLIRCIIFRRKTSNDVDNPLSLNVSVINKTVTPNLLLYFNIIA